ncbi:hypothetical protein DFP72DRAFT_848983 [Ephemerocybe angulata]|uniref:Uncharacterized protein n=1 Tax=Ephemerocybe angulata TaxID=980116 RepID=A0A8H6HXR7_9AGAR|nr:hypothetical protein DFP72DRAFT_848983 [Tulosesus angulatus]
MPVTTRHRELRTFNICDEPTATNLRNTTVTLLRRSYPDNLHKFIQIINTLITFGFDCGPESSRTVALAVSDIMNELANDPGPLFKEFQLTFTDLLHGKISCPAESKLHDFQNVAIFLADLYAVGKGLVDQKLLDSTIQVLLNPQPGEFLCSIGVLESFLWRAMSHMGEHFTNPGFYMELRSRVLSMEKELGIRNSVNVAHICESLEALHSDANRKLSLQGAVENGFGSVQQNLSRMTQMVVREVHKPVGYLDGWARHWSNWCSSSWAPNPY